MSRRKWFRAAGATGILLGALSLTGCPDAQKKAADALRAAADELEELDLDAISTEVQAEVAKTVNKENALKILKTLEAELEADIAAEAAEAG